MQEFEERPPETDAEIDNRLSAAANGGDRAAVGEFVRRHQGFLMAMARRLAGGTIEADDLLADALVGLITAWASGRGPTERARAYVIRSMRNRVIDVYRSPYSRNVALIDYEQQLPAESLSTRHVDLEAEYRRARQALAFLSADQQLVLRATVIEGRKPSELEAELNRPVTAIYALSLRARRNLRKAMLRIMLEEADPPAACTRAASQLPPIIATALEESSDSAGMKHIRQCPRCRKVFAHFSATASLLGLATCLVAGTTVFSPTSAQASSDTPLRSSPPLRLLRALRRHQIFNSLWAATPVALIVAGAAGAGAVALPQLLSASGAGDRQTLVVNTAIHQAGQASLRLSVTGVDGWSTLELSLPNGVSIRSAPPDWDCQSEGGVTTCNIKHLVNGVFSLYDDRPEPVGDYSLKLSAAVGTQLLRGTARGQIEIDPQTVMSAVES